MNRICTSLIALSLGLAAPAWAQTAAPAPTTAEAPAPADSADIGGTYRFDPQHSQVVFSYDHMGFSTSHGHVNDVTGTVTLDQADPARSSVEASFPLGSLRTLTGDLDRTLMGDEFFKGAAPDTPVTFRSTAVKPTGDRTAEVTGDLTLNGVTKPVTLAVTLNKAADNPMSGKPAVGFSAETTVKRSDFNLGAFAPAVSDEVRLTISVEAAKG